MFFEKWFNLQYFADGGEGEGDGTATGETAADAGQDKESTLRKLGVPESMLKERAKRPAKAASQQEQVKQDAAADNNSNTPKRMTWEEVMADPEYNAEMQKIVRARVREHSEASEKLDKAKNFHAVMAKKYGLDPENPDFDKLTEFALNDDSNFEEQALAEGKPVAEVKQQAAADIKQQMAQRQVQSWLSQGEELKSLYPGFDFNSEYANPEFKRLLLNGVPVKTAYYVLHMEEIQNKHAQVVTEKTLQQASNAIISGSRRPRENGTGSKAPSSTTFNIRNASRADREAFKQEILRKAALGIPTYPGG